MNKYLIAHDLGTTGNKATLFTVDGELVSRQVSPYDSHYFNESWVEQDANDWWNAVCTSTNNLIKSTGINKEDIVGISFSGQMMGCLCVDKLGNPLRPSIIWADQRAKKQSAQLEEKISQWDFYHIVGHRNTASYGIQKLMWVRDNEPEIYEQTYKALNAKDYIVFKLTNKFYTEPSDANSFACFDLHTLNWSERLLEYANIPMHKLPEIKPSTFVAGGVTEEAARLTGLAAGTPVVLGGGDGLTANVGCGSVEVGKTYSCMGTSAWIATTSEKPVFDKDMRTVTWAHIVPGLYSPNGTMQYAGGSYNWLKNTLCAMENHNANINDVSPYQYIDSEVEKSKIGSNGIIFLPYLLGERAPRWNPDARGAWIGLKPENTRGDMYRSVLEGVTMNLSICLDILQTQTNIDEILIIGGGSKGKVWRQMMADIYNTNIIVPTITEEASSMGAAVTAGVGIGIYKGFNAINKFMNIESVYKPNIENVEMYKPVKELFNDCYFALEKVFDKMAK